MILGPFVWKLMVTIKEGKIIQFDRSMMVLK